MPLMLASLSLNIILDFWQLSSGNIFLATNENEERMLRHFHNTITINKLTDSTVKTVQLLMGIEPGTSDMRHRIAGNAGNRL
jgi:hypothetical protein